MFGREGYENHWRLVGEYGDPVKDGGLLCWWQKSLIPKCTVI
jgi:hypothetical protein